MTGLIGEPIRAGRDKGRAKMRMNPVLRAGVVLVAMLAGVCGLVETAHGAGALIEPTEAGAELARVAQMDLILRDNPGPEDYLLAAHTLAIASGMRPGDAEISRLAASAAWAGGDRGLLLEATRNVIRADPRDTVAQLRLISSNINSKQTAEERLAAYDRVLGPAGKSLDASVRSRLALDAALIERELGRTDRFESRLRQAVELDITNKDAVSFAARTFTGPDTGIEELIDWQIRLLYADPFDPHVHLTIARICAGQGALDAAQRFLENGVRLFEVSGAELPASLRSQRLTLRWQQSGPRQVLESLNGPLADMRGQAAEVIAERKEAGEPHDDIRNPEDIRYDLAIERIRLLAANALEDSGAIDSSLNDLTLTTQEVITQLAEVLSAPGANQQTVAQEMIRIFVDLQVARGMVRREVDRIREEIDLFNQNIRGASNETRRAEPWITFAAGNYQQAIDETGDPAPGTLASLLVAMASEQLGDLDRATEIYKVFALTRPLDAYGGFARSRLVAMDREDEARSRAGAFLESRLSRVPAWMDRMLGDPRSFMLLQAEASTTTTTAIEGVSIHLRLRNTSSIPLGLGASRPIGSRMLVVPRALAAQSEFDGDPTPQVLDLERRLRLEPLQEIDVTVRADSAYASWLRMVNAHSSQRDRYRAVQSFQPTSRGGLGPGPLGLIAETGIVQQTALGLARGSVDELVDAISMSDSVGLRRTAIATLSRVYQTDDALKLGRAEQDRVVQVWTERFAAMTDAERTLALLVLPHGLQSLAFEAFDNAVIETIVAEGLQGARSDSGLLAAALITRVRSPDSPVFDLAAESKDEHVRRLGVLLRNRLGDARPAWSMVGPGVEAMGPRSRAGGGFGP